MASLRVLHCLRSPVGGLFRHVRDLAREQVRRGYEVGILSDDQAVDSLTDARLTELGREITLGVHKVSMSRGLGLSDLSAFLATRRLIQDLGIDVAHGHGAKGGAHARLAARSLRRTGRAVTTVYTPHGGSLNYEPGTAAARVFMTLERQLIPATDALVFESAFARRRYNDSVGGRSVRQQVTFNGLQPIEFQAPQPASDATDLLFIGELRPVKGVDVLLRALSEVRGPRPVTLTIVGDGAERGSLETLARDLGLGETVRFTGAMVARDAFRTGRIMVVPSRRESFPYVVLEAAAAAIPLISTDVGGIPEIVEGTGTELLAPDDVAGLARAIEAVLADLDSAAARACRLRDHVGRNFTVARMTDEICALYDDFAVERAA